MNTGNVVPMFVLGLASAFALGGLTASLVPDKANLKDTACVEYSVETGDCALKMTVKELVENARN